jgi:hypothetical protein
MSDIKKRRHHYVPSDGENINNTTIAAFTGAAIKPLDREPAPILVS